MAQAAEFRGVVWAGPDFGGETLVSGTYTNGSTWSVKANQGFAVNGGLVVVTGDFETQATLGYKFGGMYANNGSVTLSSIPLELMEFYRTDYVRSGIGLVYQNSPRLSINVPGSPLNGTYAFNAALGTVLQVGYAPRKLPFSINLRYTMINYTQSGIVNPRTISGNSVGLNGSVFF